MPGNKLTLDNLGEEFWLFKANFDLLYNLDPLMIQALELEQMGEEGLLPNRNIKRSEITS